MESQHFDVIVIGSGPGGEGAAMQATKLDKKVAVVERFSKIGGGCTHWATIPSKALRHAIFQITSIVSNKLFRDAGASVSLSFPELRRTAASVIERQVEMRLGFYERNSVPVFHGQAQFCDPHKLEVLDQFGGHRELTA